MSPALRVLTWCLLGLPFAFFAMALAAPRLVDAVMHGSTVFIVIVYASVWFAFRPTRFEVDAKTLRIVWPVRSREIDRDAIVDARIVTASDFRREYGYGMRVGAGGLWGGFGLLKTGRETFSMWISRTDGFVVVRLREGRPLLMTPADPDGFVRMLKPTEA
jgi:hypothetical protein